MSYKTSLRFLRPRSNCEEGFYDPTTGSFISPDSLVGWNRYAYVNNNPINMNDPSGNIPPCKKDQHCIKQDGGVSSSFVYPSSSLGSINSLLTTKNIFPLGSTNNFNQTLKTTLSRNDQNNTDENDKNTNEKNKKIEGWISGTGNDDFINNPPKGALMWGVSASGSTAIYNTAGLDEVVLMGNGNRATYDYIGQGSAVGAGVNLAAYAGIVMNIDNLAEYNGPFTSTGVTFSFFDIGVTIYYFWESSADPYDPGIIRGFAVGYAPGAEASIWGSTTSYNMNWQSK